METFKLTLYLLALCTSCLFSPAATINFDKLLSTFVNVKVPDGASQVGNTDQKNNAEDENPSDFTFQDLTSILSSFSQPKESSSLPKSSTPEQSRPDEEKDATDLNLPAVFENLFVALVGNSPPQNSLTHPESKSVSAKSEPKTSSSTFGPKSSHTAPKTGPSLTSLLSGLQYSNESNDLTEGDESKDETTSGLHNISVENEKVSQKIDVPNSVINFVSQLLPSLNDIISIASQSNEISPSDTLEILENNQETRHDEHVILLSATPSEFQQNGIVHHESKGKVHVSSNNLQTNAMSVAISLLSPFYLLSSSILLNLIGLIN